ncbi:Ethanolamine-phosphate cytidylyltransferase [Paragonimus heterotremus]|uniref:ethanolamine-phosphate cytidylyltransferase n=1 Tax=Paragonimus heterotremus TaxID=100268 RepID=A0A8J4TDS0_9TREM|nr:Ethanolamine-phosphate cytidylyltransferase [Paragonimus heterotremus]
MTNTQCTHSNDRRPIRVWVDGCFDLVHFGHANALRQAKALGDQLIVGVHSDEEVKFHKGPPVFTEQERYRLIRAIKWVDEVVEAAPYVTAVKTMDEHECAFTAHGDDITLTADGSDPYHFVKVAGRYKEFRRTEGISTTELLTRILKRLAKLEESTSITGPFEKPNLRRTRSVDFTTGTGLVPLQSSKELSTQKQSYEPTTSPLELDSESSSNSSHVGWTNCGMSYMPNTLRITQFCNGEYGLREPTADDIVVYVPGTFDLFHIGHLSFLEKCLEFGNYLVVGLYSDATAALESQRMGVILTLQERLLSVLACRYVSNVVIDAPHEVPATLLDHFKIPKQRGIFRRVDSGSSVTTTSVITRILKHRVDYEQRNRSKEAKEAKLIASLKSNVTCLGLSLKN